MDHAEKLAKAIIETVLPGSQMSYRLDQSEGVHDFDLCLLDRSVHAVEVTTSTDQVTKQTNAAILEAKKGGSVVKTVLCSKTWFIWPCHSARIDPMREKADEYLAAIESEGIRRFNGPTDLHPSVERIYEELGVVRGTVVTEDEPCYIRIALPIVGGTVGPQLVNEAIKLETLKVDNRNKLAKAGTGERHLAVYVDLGNCRAWVALDDFSPLPSFPVLPDPITHLWAYSEAWTEHEYIV